jgi:hypothetical protein
MFPVSSATTTKGHIGPAPQMASRIVDHSNRKHKCVMYANNGVLRDFARSSTTSPEVLYVTDMEKAFAVAAQFR